jgi:uracil phosphoribosyltransferase
MGANESTEEQGEVVVDDKLVPMVPSVDPIPKIDATKFNPLTVVATSKALRGLFTKMRDVRTPSADFVKYSKRAMTILAEEAMAEFPSQSIIIQTPCGPCEGVQTVDLSQVCAVSIVRSGDALLEVVRTIVPEVSVGKILIQRDESHPDKLPKLFYSKLPKKKVKYALLCDPMLATGGSAIMALDVLTVKYKIPQKNIIFANVICCPEGLTAIAQSYPRVKIVTAMVDSHLNHDKYIVPGLGDYGDRYFGT